MRPILVPFLLAVFCTTSVYCSCVFLQCPSSLHYSASVPCTNCSSCVSQSMRFCVSKRDHTCGCLSSVPEQCSRELAKGLETTSICYVSDHTRLPAPIVGPLGSTALSVTVPRFFSEPPFNTQSPSGLLLLAKFHTKKPCSCQDQFTIQAQRRGEKECILRVSLAMPGIDHKTDYHYYYDDGTDLESEFALDLFEAATEVELWTEVTLMNEAKLKSETLRFYSRARSQIISHRLPGSDPVALILDNSTTLERNTTI